MPKGNPKPNTSGLVYWQKGQSGNPKGRPKDRVKAALKVIMKSKKAMQEHTDMSLTEVNDWERLILSLTRKQLEHLGALENLPVYPVLLIKAIMGDFKHGKTSTVDSIRDRQFGALAKRIELTGAGGEALMPRELSVKEAKDFIDNLEKEL